MKIGHSAEAPAAPMPRAARWSVLGNFRKRSGLLSIERKRGDSHLMRIEPREVLKRGSFPLSGIKVLAFAFLGVASSTALARAQQMPPSQARSEEHTSEPQSLMRISYAVFCLKKKKNNNSKTPVEHVYKLMTKQF